MPIRVATVGAGFFSQFHYDAWARIKDVSVEALCALTEKEAEEAAGKYGVPSYFSNAQQMLDEVKPDLLDIISPPPTHRSLIEAALSHKVPVICQKPFTGRYDEAIAVVELSAKTKIPVIVHENFRFQPWYRQIKKLLDEEFLGDLYQTTFRLRPGDGQGAKAYLDRQPYFQKMERFLVHETAIHFIDVFRYLFGEVDSVYAELRQLNPVISGEDAGLILFQFDSGMTGVFDGNRLNDHVASNRRLTMGEMDIEGAKGILSLTGDGEIRCRPHGDMRSKTIAYNWTNHGFGGDCVYALQQQAIMYLQGKGPVSNLAEDYLNNLLIEEAVYRSNKQTKKIVLDDFQVT